METTNKTEFNTTNIETQTTEVKNVPKVWEKAKAESLLGLCATRILPVTYSKKVRDHSYSSEGVVISDVSPFGHIEYHTKFHGPSRLDWRWNDDGWARAPDNWCKEIYRKLESLNE